MTSDWEAAVRSPTRLAAVAQSGLVGIGPEDPFDRLIELAVELIGVQRGVIALVDAERTTAMSSAGFPEGLALFAPIDQSFCRFVVGSGRPFIVEDAHHDPRTSGDPAIEAFGAVLRHGFEPPRMDTKRSTGSRHLGDGCLNGNRAPEGKG